MSTLTQSGNSTATGGQSTPSPQEVSDAFLQLRWSIDRIEAVLPNLREVDAVVYNIVGPEFHRLKRDFAAFNVRQNNDAGTFSGWENAAIFVISRLQDRANNLLRQVIEVELLRYRDVRDHSSVRIRNHLRVIDVRTGLHFTLSIYSIYDGNDGHLDVVPIDGAWTTISRFRNRYCWCARPMWVIIGNRTIAASLHHFPHVGTLTGSRFDRTNGHLCLHFTETDVIDSSQQSNSQNAVQEARQAWEAPDTWNDRIASRQRVCTFRNRDPNRQNVRCSNFSLNP